MSEEETSPISYDICYTSFDSSVNNLSTHSSDCEHIVAPPRRVPGQQNKNRPYWAVCVGKFTSAFVKSTSKDTFKNSFKRFFDKYSTILSNPLFNDDDDGIINDGFFKDLSMSEHEDKDKYDEVNEGPVVYFDVDKPELRSVCIPIGELYRASVKAYVSSSKDNKKAKLLPTVVLLDLFSAIYHSLDDGNSVEKEKVEIVLSQLCGAAEAEAPGTGPGARILTTHNENNKSPFGNVESMDGAFDFVANMIGSILGKPSGGNKNENDVSNAVKGVGNVVKSLVKHVSENGGVDVSSNPDGTFDPAAIISKIGEAFQSEELQKQLSETAKNASSVINSFKGSSVGGSDNLD